MEGEITFRLSGQRWMDYRPILAAERDAVKQKTSEAERHISARGVNPMNSATVVFGKAFISRLNQIISAGDSGQLFSADLFADFLKLRSLVFPPSVMPKGSNAEQEVRTKTLQMALEGGLPADVAIKYMDAKQVGHPPEKRELFITAHEMKEVYGQTWREITDQICDCPKRVHTVFCKGSIENGVRQQIRPLVRKYRDELGQ